MPALVNTQVSAIDTLIIWHTRNTAQVVGQQWVETMGETIGFTLRLSLCFMQTKKHALTLSFALSVFHFLSAELVAVLSTAFNSRRCPHMVRKTKIKFSKSFQCEK
jgi:hypothetical protein